ncbi:MAG: hypothetical protein AAF202_06250 [Pseudomonadota bacterium]
MKVLLEDYDYFFNIRNNEISKTSLDPMFRLNIDFDSLEMNKACVKMVSKPHLLVDRNPDQRYPMVQFTVFGDKTSHGAVRFYISGEFSYYIQLRSGRHVGSMGAFYLRDIDKVRERYPLKAAKFNKSQKDMIQEGLDLMGFEPTGGELKEHFYGFKYRASAHNFPRRRNAMFVEDDVILALSSIKRQLRSQPLFGPDAAWKAPEMEKLEDVFAVIGVLQKFADHFSSIRPSWYQVEIDGVDDFPTGANEVTDWHHFHFLLSKIPAFDHLLIQECSSEFSLAPHENLYCGLLREEIEKQGNSYSQFLEKEYTSRRPLSGLRGFINRRGRANVVQRYLELSATVIAKIWEEKRETVQEDIEFNQQALQTTQNMRNGIDALLPLLISQKILEAKAQGFGFVAELMQGEISQEDFDDKLLALTAEKRAEAVRVKDEFMELRSGAFEDLDEIDERFVDGANQLNPFDKPFEHMAF